MLEYFMHQICDELHGAIDYAKMAVEYKTARPAWAKMYLDMSNAEANHATNLYKMCDEYYKNAISSYTEPPKYMKKCWDDIVEEYTEKFAKARNIQEMYNR